MRILLDTSAYSALLRGHGDVADRVRRAEQVVFSTVVAGELLLGFRLGSRLKKNMAELDAFLENPYVSLVPVTLTTADRFARIASDERHLDRCALHGNWRRAVVVRCALRSD